MPVPRGRRFGGRQKGTCNKLTVSVKEALDETFERRGGVTALVAWSKKDPSGFYHLWGRLLPKQVNMNAEVGERLEDILHRIWSARGR